MFGNVVKLVFQSASIGSGLDDFISKTKQGLTNSNMLGQGIAKLSTVFGGLGASIGGAVNMLLHGGVWGAAAEGVKMVIGAIQKWRAEAALAAEMNAKAMKESAERAKEAAEAMKASYQKSNEMIDAAAKKKLEDIELTKKQTKAELELAAAKARAAGDDTKASKLEQQASQAEAKAAEDSAKVSVKAAEDKLKAAKDAAKYLPGWKTKNGVQANGSDKDGLYAPRTTGKDFEFDGKKWDKERRKVRDRINELEGILNPATRQKSWSQSVYEAQGFWGKTKAFLGIPEGKENNTGVQDPTQRKKLQEELEGLRNSLTYLKENWKKAKQAAENIAEAERVLTNARKSEQAVIVENQKSIVIARATAAKASKEEQLKKLRDDKSGLDAKRSSSASEVSRWQGEFNTAFDLWRDPEAAASAVEADKKRGEDIKRFRKEVNRYGGKGKIDEYARLMREGDEEGMQERLSEWRKSSKFTPQVEQMVKAAAADQNKNAAEKSLANIEKDVSGLTKKIDELLSLK